MIDRKNFTAQAKAKFQALSEKAAAKPSTAHYVAKFAEAAEKLDAVENGWLSERKRLPFWSTAGKTDLFTQLVGAPATW